MPEALLAGIYAPGLLPLIAVAAVAGTVYGFAGFGAALIFMPVASIFLMPKMAAAVLSVLALGSLVTLVPGAWRICDRRATLGLLIPALAMVPVGTVLLARADTGLLRWAVSAVVLGTLLLMLTGWRHAQAPGLPARIGVGGLVGLLGGSVGLNGPVLVLFQLAGPDSIERRRATTIVVLTLSGLALFPALLLHSAITAQAFWLGLLLLVPYWGGTLLGRALFDPQQAGAYQIAAYALIGASGILGLPILT